MVPAKRNISNCRSLPQLCAIIFDRSMHLVTCKAMHIVNRSRTRPWTVYTSPSGFLGLVSYSTSSISRISAQHATRSPGQADGRASVDLLLLLVTSHKPQDIFTYNGCYYMMRYRITGQIVVEMDYDNRMSAPLTQHCATFSKLRRAGIRLWSNRMVVMT